MHDRKLLYLKHSRKNLILYSNATLIKLKIKRLKLLSKLAHDTLPSNVFSTIDYTKLFLTLFLVFIRILLEACTVICTVIFVEKNCKVVTE